MTICSIASYDLTLKFIFVFNCRSSNNDTLLITSVAKQILNLSVDRFCRKSQIRNFQIDWEKTDKIFRSFRRKLRRRKLMEHAPVDFPAMVERLYLPTYVGDLSQHHDP